MIVHACNPSPREAETGAPWVRSKQWLHRIKVFEQKPKKKEDKNNPNNWIKNYSFIVHVKCFDFTYDFTCWLCACKDQKRVLSSLKLLYQTPVNCHGNSGKATQVFWRSNKCSYLLSYLAYPQMIFSNNILCD